MINPGDQPECGQPWHRYFGYLIPPVSGDYIFYVSSDDNSQSLTLSTDDNPANKRQIAIEPPVKRLAPLKSK